MLYFFLCISMVEKNVCFQYIMYVELTTFLCQWDHLLFHFLYCFKNNLIIENTLIVVFLLCISMIEKHVCFQYIMYVELTTFLCQWDHLLFHFLYCFNNNLIIENTLNVVFIFVYFNGWKTCMLPLHNVC